MATRCRKLINRRLYDTTVSRSLGGWCDNYTDELLFLAPDGEYFLYTCSNYGTTKTDIRPLTYEEARRWASNMLPKYQYISIFGDEATTK